MKSFLGANLGPTAHRSLSPSRVPAGPDAGPSTRNALRALPSRGMTANFGAPGMNR